MDSDTPSRSKADGLATEINALHSRMMAIHIDQLFRTREILTPEQFRALEAMKNKSRQERRGRREFRK